MPIDHGSANSLPDPFAQPGQFREVLTDRLSGWPIVPVMEWMSQSGRHLSETNDLTQRLAEKMIEVNAPIVRLRLSMHTGDSEVPGWSAVWELGQPLERDRIARPGFTNRSAYKSSPLAIVDATQCPYRARLDGDNMDNAHAILRELLAQGATDYIALPLMLVSLKLASIVLVTDRICGFTDEDIKKFTVLTSALAPTFESVDLRSRSAPRADAHA